MLCFICGYIYSELYQLFYILQERCFHFYLKKIFDFERGIKYDQYVYVFDLPSPATIFFDYYIYIYSLFQNTLLIDKIIYYILCTKAHC